MRQLIQMKHFLVLSAALVALSVALPGVSQAVQIVHSGFDLFLTAPPASFDFTGAPNPQVVDFEGDPLGCFDFGDGNGCVNTGPTDTIVERLDTTLDFTGINYTIDIEIVALSLVSIDPVDLGFGAGFEDIIITLNTSSPSIQSTMTLFDGAGVAGSEGTFDSTLNFSFDVTGSVGGFYTTIEQTFNSAGTSWWHDHQATELTIDGVNHNLNAGSPDQDFFLYPGEVLHTGPHPVVPAPEPTTASLLALGLVGIAAVRRRRTAS
jgi:hypothetical protein